MRAAATRTVFPPAKYYFRTVTPFCGVPSMYRPKFCAECGEKIVRLRWRCWTSRRFCGPCAPRFRRGTLSRFAFLGLGVLGLGIFLGQAARSHPPLVIERRQETAASSVILNENANRNSASGPTSVAEEIYVCGARTKKGTPCSRRVHGPVRCWQHKGMPAMLSPEKLRVKE
jgi:hypothetical protein